MPVECKLKVDITYTDGNGKKFTALKESILYLHSQREGYGILRLGNKMFIAKNEEFEIIKR